jgi:LPXTG-site transpeptidase (sortase) family protein
VEVEITNATAADELRLVSGGSLTVSGSAVYWSGDRIGTIDGVYDGSNGRLRINFSAVAPLVNADFETGDLTGWTVDNSNNQMQGQSWAEAPAGWATCSGINQDTTPLFDEGLPGNTRSASVIPAAAREGSYGLEMRIEGEVTAGCGTDHAPSVTSSGFTAAIGDSLSMFWFAAQTSDYYDVFGFVFDDTDDDGIWDPTENSQRLFHETGDQTAGWETLNTTLTIGGTNLRFLFINGTFDNTGGQVIGSYLYIDGIDLQIANVTVANNAILANVIEHIEYQNMLENPISPKDYNLNFLESDGGTGFNTAQIIISQFLPPVPETGFAPDRVTVLPTQPESITYADMGYLTLDIPALDLSSSIVGVPLSADGWDVTWLGNNVGYLYGTSFPLWPGNTAITAHVVLPDGNPGPFAELHNLQWGDDVVIQYGPWRYIFDVRQVNLVSARSRSVFQHEDMYWLTLITCRGYDEQLGSYRWRTVVRAVLVSIE